MEFNVKIDMKNGTVNGVPLDQAIAQSMRQTARFQADEERAIAANGGTYPTGPAVSVPKRAAVR